MGCRGLKGCYLTSTSNHNTWENGQLEDRGEQFDKKCMGLDLQAQPFSSSPLV